MTAIARAAALAAAALVLALPPTAPAQDLAPAGSASAQLPRRPIPYTQLVRRPSARATAARRRVVSARPAPAAATAAPAPILPQQPGARLAPAASIPPAELEAFVDGAVGQAMGSGRIPGVVVTVVQDGQVVLEKGYGAAAPGRAVDPRATLFRLGSASEALTWIAVLKAAEEGRLKLDQPVNTLLPPPLRLRDGGFREPVRMRDLMAHTSGLEAREAGRLYSLDSGRVRSLSEALRRDPPRRVRPLGQPSSWSPADAAVAGAVLEAVYGQPFADLMSARVLGPLGLAHTSFREPYRARADLAAPLSPALAEAEAVGVDARGRPVGPVFSPMYAPAVSGSSTADDMGRLMRAWLGAGALDGATAWGPGVAAALRAPMAQPGMAQPGLGLNGWPGGWVQSTAPGGFAAYGRGGAAPGFRARLQVVPDLRLGVFAAANGEAAGAVVDGLARNLVAGFYAPTSPPSPSGGLAGSARTYVGDYLSTRRAHHGLEKFVDHLRRIARVRALGDGRLLVASPDGRRLLAPAPGGGFVTQGSGEPVAFSVGRGRADGFTSAENLESFRRLGVVYAPHTLGWATAFALLLSLAVLAGGVVRLLGRDSRRTGAQSLAALLQSLAAVGWLAAAAAFAAWLPSAGVPLRWPGGWLVTASALALAAALLALLSLLWLPQVWRGDRRGFGWGAGRKLAHSLVTFAFVGYGALLAVWGALVPWAS